MKPQTENNFYKFNIKTIEGKKIYMFVMYHPEGAIYSIKSLMKINEKGFYNNISPSIKIQKPTYKQITKNQFIKYIIKSKQSDNKDFKTYYNGVHFWIFDNGKVSEMDDYLLISRVNIYSKADNGAFFKIFRIVNKERQEKIKRIGTKYDDIEMSLRYHIFDYNKTNEKDDRLIREVIASFYNISSIYGHVDKFAKAYINILIMIHKFETRKKSSK